MKKRSLATISQGLLLGVSTKVDRLNLRAKIFFRRKLGLLGAYQPVRLGSRHTDPPAGRHSADRFEAIIGALPSDSACSVLDIGCNEGYFTLRMAERGAFAIGVDVSQISIHNAQDIARFNNTPTAIFAMFDIDVKTVALLPKVDLVICLSIYHHWARKLGEDEAFRIMQGLANKSEKYMVFETGHPNENNVDWKTDLDFMKPDYDEYVRGLLKRLGFIHVENIGLFATTVSDVPRNLYLARKK